MPISNNFSSTGTVYYIYRYFGLYRTGLRTIKQRWYIFTIAKGSTSACFSESITLTDRTTEADVHEFFSFR